MPEIVEVKLLTDQLHKHLVGKKVIWSLIKSKRTKKYKMFWGQVKRRIFIVRKVWQKGKLIIFDLLNDKTKLKVFVTNELRLAGRWSKESSGSYDFFKLRVHNSNDVWYSDKRGFSTFEFYSSVKDLRHKLDQRGPDILSGISTPKYFIERICLHSNWQIVKSLLDQASISGIGNWIKSDVLYLAKIDPRARVGKLSDKELSRLYKVIMQVIKKSIKLGGSTGYIGFNGKKGGYDFAIYGKKEVKEGSVKTAKFTDGRTTHWVPSMFKK